MADLDFANSPCAQQAEAAEAAEAEAEAAMGQQQNNRLRKDQIKSIFRP